MKELSGNSTTGIVAHRGAFKANQLPENSIAALKEAIRLQCAGSEFDVRLTADDTLVVIHDAAHAGFNVEKDSYTSLSAHILSNGEKIPTLREYLQAGKDQSQTKLVVEIKPSGVGKDRSVLSAQLAVDMIKEMDLASNVIFISFDYDVLKKIAALAPGIPLQYLNGDKSPAQVKADGILGLDYHFTVFRNKPEWITEAKNLGMVLNAWTVNNAADMDWLLSHQFNFITTDEPALLAQRIEQLKR